MPPSPSPSSPLRSRSLTPMLCCSVIVLFRCRRRERAGRQTSDFVRFQMLKELRGEGPLKLSPSGTDLVRVDIKRRRFSPGNSLPASFNFLGEGRPCHAALYWCVFCEWLRQNNGRHRLHAARHNGLLKGRMMGCWSVGWLVGVAGSGGDRRGLMALNQSESGRWK